MEIGVERWIVEGNCALKMGVREFSMAYFSYSACHVNSFPRREDCVAFPNRKIIG